MARMILLGILVIAWSQDNKLTLFQLKWDFKNGLKKDDIFILSKLRSVSVSLK